MVDIYELLNCKQQQNGPYLQVCVCMCGLIRRTGKGCWQVEVSGWWDVMDVFGQRSANSALLHYRQPVTLTNAHWGIPINVLHIRNQSWMNRWFNYLPFCITLFLVFCPFSFYTVCNSTFTTATCHWENIFKATNLYHLGNITVSTL